MKKRLYYVAYSYADDNGNFGYGDGTIIVDYDVYTYQGILNLKREISDALNNLNNLNRISIYNIIPLKDNVDE